MSADEHSEMAVMHERMADSHRAQYDPNARDARAAPVAPPRIRGFFSDGGTWPIVQYNPTAHHQGEADLQLQMARQHDESAQALRVFEDRECRSIPAVARSRCPLIGHLAAVEPIQDGARLTFVEDVPLEVVEAHMRCHAAFARKVGYGGMPDCPLYVSGIQLRRSGPRSIDVTGVGAAVEQIRARSLKHLSDFVEGNDSSGEVSE